VQYLEPIPALYLPIEKFPPWANTLKRLHVDVGAVRYVFSSSKMCNCFYILYQNLIALGAEDNTLTISNAEGDTLNTVGARIGYGCLLSPMY
jgi:hypothetical protein